MFLVGVVVVVAYSEEIQCHRGAGAGAVAIVMHVQ